MCRIKLVRITIMATLALCLFSGSATAVSYALTSPGPLGIDVGFGCVTGTPGCSGSPDYTLDSTADATGTFDVTGSGVATASLLLSVSDPIALSGGPIGADAIDHVEFLGASLSFAGISMLESPLAGGITSYTQLNNVTGSFSGTFVVSSGGSIIGSTPFATTATLNALSCTTPSGQCGFNLILPSFLIPSGESLDFTLQANMLVPEPSTALMVAIGLAGLGIHRRRRS
jgi:hypothetical protein